MPAELPGKPVQTQLWISLSMENNLLSDRPRLGLEPYPQFRNRGSRLASCIRRKTSSLRGSQRFNGPCKSIAAGTRGCRGII